MLIILLCVMPPYLVTVAEINTHYILLFINMLYLLGLIRKCTLNIYISIIWDYH